MIAKPEILLIDQLMPSTEAAMGQRYLLHRLYAERDPVALICQIGLRIRAVVTNAPTGVSDDILNALPNLELIALNGIGTDAVDLELARARNIRVTITPGVLTDDVADLAIGLLLAVARRICVGDRFVREGRWARGESLPPSRKVSGKRLGIVGLGHIGRAIARRAAGFDLQIAYTGPDAVDGVEYRFEPDLERLARDSDFLAISAAGGPQSRGIVSEAVLNALGREGVLINVARGSIVEEDALVSALAEGRLGGAGLDVFAHEPNVPEALRSMDQVVLQSHRATTTIETRLAMGELVIANLDAHFAGKELP
ncbi:MAG: 2-hydroxyacid dehydrogenase, partial [Candidatus Cybelea sp.]